MEPIVFVPGLLCSELLFARQIAAFGDSPILVADHRSDDSLAAIAERLLTAVPGRFSLAGLSMGGYVAMEVMRQAPERVSRLMLLDTSARPDTAAQTANRQRLMEHAAAGRFDRIVPALFPMLVHKNRVEDAHLRQVVEEMARETGADAFLRQQRAIIARPDARPNLAAIACPTTIVVGEGDRLTPPELAAEIHRAIPGSRLVEIPDCGHLSTLEAPEAVVGLMRDWLAD